MGNDNIKIIELNSPYHNWEDKEVRKYYTKMIGIKLKGYQKEYRYGVLPVDSTDLVSNHLIFCLENEDGSLTPVSAVKSFPLDACAQFHLPFTLSRMLQDSFADEHLAVVKEILDQCQINNTRVSYYSSWTISPHIRKNRKLVKKLKDGLSASTALFHLSQGITELLGLGVPKFQTDLYFSTWGYAPIKKKGVEMPSINIHSYDDIEVLVMHLKEFSKEILDLSKEYLDSWNNRVILGNQIEYSYKLKEKRVAA